MLLLLTLFMLRYTLLKMSCDCYNYFIFCLFLLLLLLLLLVVLLVVVIIVVVVVWVTIWQQCYIYLLFLVVVVVPSLCDMISLHSQQKARRAPHHFGHQERQHGPQVSYRVYSIIFFCRFFPHASINLCLLMYLKSNSVVKKIS